MGVVPSFIYTSVNIQSYIKFYKVGDNPQKVSFIKSFAGKMTAKGLSETENLINSFESFIKQIKSRKIPVENINKIINDCNQLNKSINFFLNILKKYEMDDHISRKILNKSIKVKNMLESTLTLLKNYKEVEQANLDFKKGDVLTHKELLDVL
ncbi:MAG: hypothetical protein IIA88_07285 [Bacteroidetes bacterium]|nr:hypothetical protein [Bacteroidota bacterium]